jgi:hypothetical protein
VLALQLEGHHQLARAEAARDDLGEHRVDRKFGQLDFLDQQIAGEQLADLALLHPVLLEQQRDHRLRAALLQQRELLQLGRRQQVFLVQHDPQPAAVGGGQLGEGADLLGLLGVLGLERPVAGDQVELLQRQRHGDAQVVVVPGLEDELVHRAFVDRAHDRVGVGVAGEHDADRVGRTLFHLLQKLGAVHARHHEVADDQVHRTLGQAFEPFLAAAGGEDVVVFLAKHAPQRPHDADLVIHQQQAVLRRCEMAGRRLRRARLAGEKALVVGHGVFGKNRLTVVPAPGVLSIAMRPRWASTMLRAVDSPSPVPAPTERVV